MALLTTFYWNNVSFSGVAQLNLGPFFVGFVNKFYRFETRGRANFAGALYGGGSVQANRLAWGLQQVPHGNSPLDCVTSFDSSTWLMRSQAGAYDNRVFWAPDTANANVLEGSAIYDDWRGQLAIGADTDLYMSFKDSTGVGLGNFNTIGTVRLWWN